MVIDCQIDCDDKVWPMVAPGAAISEAFDEDDLKEKYNNDQYNDRNAVDDNRQVRERGWKEK